MKPHRLIITAGVLFGWLATVAAAPTLSVTFEGVSPGIGSAGQYNWNSGSTHIEGILYTPFGNGSSSANHFITFCIERNQTIGGGTHTGYQFTALESSPVPGPPMSGTTANAIRAMWAEFRDDLDVGPDQADRSAAFQHAVWHLMDGNYNPDATVRHGSYYSTYLNSSNWLSGLADLAVMSNGGQQDQLVQMSGIGVLATPEPTTLLIGLLAAPALYLRRRFTARVA